MSDVEILDPAGGNPPPGRVEAWQEQPSWSLDQLVASFLAGLNNSEETRAAYRRDLRQYLAWCAEHEIEPLRAGLPELRMYAYHLAHTAGGHRWGSTGKPLAPRTQSRKLNVVSVFYRYLVQSGTLAANPARELDRPRYDRTYSPTRGLTEREARDMLALVPETAQRSIDPRCAALCLHLMIDIGARVTEVCNINLADLGHQDGLRVVTLRMKGGTVRVRPIPPQIAGLLDAWRMRRPTGGEAPEALLVDRKGQRLKRQQVSYLLLRTARAAGIEDASRVSPHSTRHGFNRIAKARGASPELRQQALGHKSLSTTQLYDAKDADLGSDPAYLVASATFTPYPEQDDGEAPESGQEREETGDGDE